MPISSHGRSMKVGKEELVGAYAAVKYFMARDENEVAREVEQQTDYIVKHLNGIPHIVAKKVSGTRVEFQIDHNAIGMDLQATRDALLCDSDGILFAGGARCLAANVLTLELGEEQIIVQQLRRLCTGELGPSNA